MSIEQLIPSLGKELNKLRARLAHVEELLGVGVSVEKSSNVDRSCLICGITWQMGVTSVPQHMVGRRHRANMEKLSKFPPPPFKAPTPSFKLPPPPFKAPTPSSKISPLSSLNVHSSSFMPDATSSQSTVCTSVELSTKSKVSFFHRINLYFSRCGWTYIEENITQFRSSSFPSLAHMQRGRLLLPSWPSPK